MITALTILITMVRIVVVTALIVGVRWSLRKIFKYDVKPKYKPSKVTTSEWDKL